MPAMSSVEPAPTVNEPMLLFPPIVMLGVRMVVVPAPAAVVTEEATLFNVVPLLPTTNPLPAVMLLLEGRSSVPMAVPVLLVTPTLTLVTLAVNPAAAEALRPPVALVPPAGAVFRVSPRGGLIALSPARVPPPGGVEG